jgi:hypothetical protein
LLIFPTPQRCHLPAQALAHSPVVAASRLSQQFVRRNDWHAKSEEDVSCNTTNEGGRCLESIARLEYLAAALILPQPHA